MSAFDPALAERRAVGVLLLIYFVVQANAALHHGSWGQDFSSHLGWIAAARADPWAFLVHPGYRPEPPVFHLFGAAVFELTDGRDSLETIAFLSIAANLLGLVMAYRLLSRLVENRILRLSCLTFIAFLPVMMIHEVVLASDAFTLPIFLGILTLLAASVESRFSHAFWPRIVSISVLLIIGVETKYTFASQAVALFGMFCIFPLLKLIGRRRALQSLLTVGIAGAIALALVFNVSGNFGLNHSKGTMTWRDILFVHRQDVRILSAPKYNEPLPGVNSSPEQYELLIPGRYSYPALAHLAVFTDILNIYQDDPKDSYFGQRTRKNQSRMRLAVKTGLIFSLLGCFLTAAAVVRTSYLTLAKRKEEGVLRFMLALCGLGWFLNILVFLPSVQYAYMGGYWLPRLVLPALLSFTILSFTELDRFVRQSSSRWSWAILILVVLQSAIHVSFLWPHGFARSIKLTGGIG